MAETQAAKLDDVLRWEADSLYCREAVVVLDGQTFAIGTVGYLNADSKAVVSAVAANEVQTITFDAAMTAGDLAITVFAPDGEPLPVSVVWDTNIATTIAAWNVAMTAAATVWAGTASVGAVMTGDATTPILTFSGVGFAGLPVQTVVPDISGTTGPTYATVAETTKGHSAGGDATLVALEAAAPSGADGAMVALVRGPAVVESTSLAVPTAGLALVTAALKLQGIIVRTSPQYTQTLPA